MINYIFVDCLKFAVNAHINSESGFYAKTNHFFYFSVKKFSLKPSSNRLQFTIQHRKRTKKLLKSLTIYNNRK